MYFKDWDTQRAAESEVFEDRREEEKRKTTQEEKIFSPPIKLWKAERKRVTEIWI